MIDWLTRSASEQQIAIGDKSVPIVIRRLKSAKRLTLRLAPDGSEVRVSMPKWAPTREAIAFAHSRADWLSAQAAKIPRREAPQAGGTVLYRGETLTIGWDEKARRTPARDGDILRVGGPVEGIEPRIRRWLEREALHLFESDARDYCAVARIEPVPVALSRAQKRWGSCSDRRRIRLNWRLVQAPDHVRRSVVAHEVAHLVHFDHSPAFHALLGQIYEADIRIADRWLKEHGRSLYAAFG